MAKQQQQQHWGYSAPDLWPQPKGAGRLQSPINILVAGGCQPAGCCKCARRQRLDSTGADEEEARSAPPSPQREPAGADPERRKHAQATRHCVSNRKIFLGYPRYLHKLRLCNTGHGWQAQLPAELAAHNLIAGPPLAEREYRLAQFHCHWGRDDQRGSEHQINGRSYSAELHFVHWNCSQFESAEQAAEHKHGLAVLAVLVEALEGEQARNRHLEKLVQAVSGIRAAGASCEIDARLDLKKLFPANRWAYASYEGSLTTPPLSEVVDWVVFLEPIQCSASQLAQFRRLRCNQDRELRQNCRPVQATNERLVKIWSHH